MTTDSTPNRDSIIRAIAALILTTKSGGGSAQHNAYLDFVSTYEVTDSELEQAHGLLEELYTTVITEGEEEGL